MQLMVTDMYKKEIRKVVIKACSERRKISLLKDVKIRKRFEEVFKLVDVGMPSLWECFMDAILEACDEMCVRVRQNYRRYMVVE